ncbi:hypothetical protein NC651_031274 [Populus alba x Populus x berolinensis]|nr:hypothetical protein NC651_031274 [Populus alba x Populus x berolinensis]
MGWHCGVEQSWSIPILLGSGTQAYAMVPENQTRKIRLMDIIRPIPSTAASGREPMLKQRCFCLQFREPSEASQECVAMPSLQRGCPCSVQEFK